MEEIETLKVGFLFEEELSEYETIFFNEYVYVLFQRYKKIEVSQKDYKLFCDNATTLESLIQKYDVIFEEEEPLDASIFDRYEVYEEIE